MRVLITNPRVAAVIRRRHTTLVVLRERNQDVELMFTSLQLLEQLADNIDDGVAAALDGMAGTQWNNPNIPLPKRRIDEEYGDLFYDAGLLDRPEFMRRSQGRNQVQDSDSRRAPVRSQNQNPDSPRGPRVEKLGGVNPERE